MVGRGKGDVNCAWQNEALVSSSSSSSNNIRNQGNSVNIVTRLCSGRSGFDFREGRDSSFATASRPALGSTQPPIHWVHRTISLGVKRPGREADHSPPATAEVKNVWSHTPTSIRLLGVLFG
jgi:hypothetical protein